jgi:hypothetical protein
MGLATTASQFSPNRCRHFRNRSESLMVRRLARLAPKSALPASAMERLRRQT